jgi:hypothetical protein
LLGDDEGVLILYESIPGAKDASAIIGPGFFTVPCNRVPTVGITLGNQIFNVAPAIFNLGLLEGNDCVGGVVSSDGIRRQHYCSLHYRSLTGFIHSVLGIGGCIPQGEYFTN